MYPEDRPLLGMQWKGEYFLDAMLHFGLRSAPRIFTAVADALEWCTWQNGVVGIDHYLDDFVVVVPPGPGVSGSIRGGMYSVGGDLGSREEGRAENQIDIPGYRGGHCSWLFVPPGR